MRQPLRVHCCKHWYVWCNGVMISVICFCVFLRGTCSWPFSPCSQWIGALATRWWQPSRLRVARLSSSRLRGMQRALRLRRSSAVALTRKRTNTHNTPFSLLELSFLFLSEHSHRMEPHLALPSNPPPMALSCSSLHPLLRTLTTFNDPALATHFAHFAACRAQACE